LTFLLQNYWQSLLIRGFENLSKISIIFLIPIFYDYEFASKVQLYLGYVFCLSSLVNFGFDYTILKDHSINGFNQNIYNQFFNCLKNFAIGYTVLSVFFLIIFKIFNFAEFYSIFFLNKYFMSIIISSISFSIFNLISYSLRGLGNIYLSQIIIGSLWPLFFLKFLFLLDFFTKTLDESVFIRNAWIIFLSTVIPSIIIYFLILKKSIRKLRKKITSSKINFNFFFYFQSLLSFFIIWLPPIFFGIFNNEISTGIFATKYRLGFSLIGILSIVTFLSSRDFSYLFNLKKRIDLVNKFKSYKYLKSILIIFLGSCLILTLYFLDKYFDKNFFDIDILLFLTIIILGNLFGPTDDILNLSNNEKYVTSLNFHLFISILLFILVSSILNLNSIYLFFLISVAIFIKNFFSFRIMINNLMLDNKKIFENE
tara:strand:- start:190 stop:1467 length:1278 start_codon:yes stop_codon:yes gene_type:complete